VVAVVAVVAVVVGLPLKNAKRIISSSGCVVVVVVVTVVVVLLPVSFPTATAAYALVSSGPKKSSA
jgi:uncharacterized membrane protein YkvI